MAPYCIQLLFKLFLRYRAVVEVDQHRFGKVFAIRRDNGNDIAFHIHHAAALHPWKIHLNTGNPHKRSCQYEKEQQQKHQVDESHQRRPS